MHGCDPANEHSRTLSPLKRDHLPRQRKWRLEWLDRLTYKLLRACTSCDPRCVRPTTATNTAKTRTHDFVWLPGVVEVSSAHSVHMRFHDAYTLQQTRSVSLLAFSSNRVAIFRDDELSFVRLSSSPLLTPLSPCLRAALPFGLRTAQVWPKIVFAARPRDRGVVSTIQDAFHRSI